MSELTTFQNYVRKNWSQSNPSDETLRHLFIMSTGLGGEAGEVQELLKKFIRDDKKIEPDLLLELGDLLHYLTRIGQRFNMTLEQIMAANMNKLDARHNRDPNVSRAK